MNTLSRAITAQIFPDNNSYMTLQSQWRVLVNSPRKHELKAAHYLLYQALRGKDWRKAFTPISNQRKLDNGAFESWGLIQAFNTLHSRVWEGALLAPFDGLVTAEMLQLVRSLMLNHNFYALRKHQLSLHSFPFEAYKLPETLLVSDKGAVNG